MHSTSDVREGEVLRKSERDANNSSRERVRRATEGKKAAVLAAQAVGDVGKRRIREGEQKGREEK